MKEKIKHISLPTTVRIKFNVVGTTKRGETLGSQVIDIDTENEEYKKQISTNSISCDLWVFSKTVGQMDDIRLGTKYSENLRKLQILQFSIAKKTADTKLPDKEKLIDKILKDVQEGVNRKDYPFKIIVHVIGAKDYLIFSNNKKPTVTKDPY